MAAPQKRRTGRGARARRRKMIAGGLILALVLALALAAFSYLSRQPRLVLTGNDRFQVGEEVYLSDVVKDVQNGTLASGDVKLNSETEGTREITVIVLDRMGRELEKTVKVTFWREPFSPVITAPETLSLVVEEGKEPDFDVMAGVSASDENGKTYPVKAEGDYDLTADGTYTITYVVESEDGRRVVKDATLTVTVVRSPFDENGELIDGVYKTAKGFDLVVENGLATIDGILIVNKSYPVPEGFSSTGDGTRTMRKEAMDAWYEMSAAAPTDVKVSLRIKSGVRNISDQTVIFNNYVKESGMEEALTFSARPRHSEHHTGLAMDITVASREAARMPQNKIVMDWLNENAWQYGFIQRYPENKTNETGYIYEPWHYRFVGRDLAAKLYNGGDWITLEDYFGIDSEYKD